MSRKRVNRKKTSRKAGDQHALRLFTKPLAILFAKPLAKLLPWLRLSSVSISFLVLFSVLAYYSSKTVIAFMEKPIATVVVQGEFNYLAQQQIRKLIAQEITGSFVHENLNNMRQTIEANPWVDQVHLRRQWPDQLLIKVTEQQPIARWGLDGFVNHRGEMIKVDADRRLKALPELRGDEQQALKILQQFQVLSDLLAKYQLEITTLERNSLGVWLLTLNNEWEIIAGRSQVEQKLKRFMLMLEQKQIEQAENIAVIDMRYSSGIAIQWKDKVADEQLVKDTIGPDNLSSSILLKRGQSTPRFLAARLMSSRLVVNRLVINKLVINKSLREQENGHA